MPIAQTVEDTVLGEAKAGDYADMVGIVSVIDNRSRQLGVSYEDVVSAKDAKGRQQFDAYSKALPAGVGKFRDMARQALAEVRERGPVHAATFYATPAAAKGLPRGLAFETKTAGHNYYTDPQGRSVLTAQGYKTPNPEAVAETRNVAGQPSDTLYDVVEATPQAAPSFAALPEVGPTPIGRPTEQTGQARGLAALSPSFAPATSPAMSFKSPTVASAFSAMSPAMQTSYRGVERGLSNPGAYTVTSTAEARGRGTPSATHVRDAGAFDVRTRGMEQKALDDLAVAAMYDKGVKSISWDHTGFSPHAHIGTSTAYGAGLQAKSDISGLSPDVQDALRGWDASIRTGEEFSPMVPESIAPTPIDRAAPVGPVERGFLSDVPGYGQSTYAAPVGTVERSGLANVAEPATTAAPVGPSYNIDQAGLTAPGFTGPAARSVSTQAIGPTGIASVAAPSSTSYGPAGQTPAGFAELGAIGKMGRAGVAAPSFAPESIVGPISMPTVGPNFGPVAAPAAPMDVRAPTTRPTFAPPAPLSIPAPLSPTQAAPSRQSAPAMASAADVWGGLAPTGRATNGNVVSRTPDGRVSMTSSKYGYTEVDGQYRGKVDPSQVGIPGPLGPQATAQAAPAIGPTRGRQGGFGSMARGMAGGLAGSMVGGAMMGPLGGILGGYLGRAFAQGKLGRSRSSQAQAAFARGFTPGLGFPTAPIGPSSQGGLTSFGEAASRGEFGGQAQSAANNPGKGLY